MVVLSWFYLMGISSVAKAQTGVFEKIRDISPDKKFAVQIVFRGEPDHVNNIDSTLITAIKLVALPSKTVVMDIPQSYSGSVPNLVWSQDSNWLTFSLASGPRVSDTYVYHRSGAAFAKLQTDDLQVDIQGDVRNQYVSPIRWLKPGTLMLKQQVIFRDSQDATYQFAAVFEERTGQFRIISKKKVRSKTE
ncbi:MAG: hypothetical protein JO308_18425 [Verrucomicrobia bacterium]|nr:hypothetical protein [Verrucomicrobiota bacterium]